MQEERLTPDCVICRVRGPHQGLCVNVPPPARRRLSERRRGDLSRELREFFLHEPGAVSSNYGGIAALALLGVRTSAGNAFGDEIAIARMRRIHRAVGRHGGPCRVTWDGAAWQIERAVIACQLADPLRRLELSGNPGELPRKGVANVP